MSSSLSHPRGDLGPELLPTLVVLETVWCLAPRADGFSSHRDPKTSRRLKIRFKTRINPLYWSSL